MKIVRMPLIFMLVFLISQVSAQEKKKEEPKYGWNNNIVGGLNLTQTSFDNWEQGGENSLSWQLNLNASFERNEVKYNWTSTGKISYGRVKLGSQDSRKSVDEIRLESVYTKKLTSVVNPYVSVTGETQFSKGYKYTDSGRVAISDFMDPAYFTQGIGLGYAYRDILKVRVGAALKETIASDYPRLYTDDPSTPEIEESKVEPGAESAVDYRQELAKNILLTSKLELFSNLEALNQVDVRWDTVLAAKVAKYVDVNFNVKLFYDRDISKKRQLKQALALGLTYTFL